MLTPNTFWIAASRYAESCRLSPSETSVITRESTPVWQTLNCFTFPGSLSKTSMKYSPKTGMPRGPCSRSELRPSAR